MRKKFVFLYWFSDNLSHRKKYIYAFNIAYVKCLCPGMWRQSLRGRQTDNENGQVELGKYRNTNVS